MATNEESPMEVDETDTGGGDASNITESAVAVDGTETDGGGGDASNISESVSVLDGAEKIASLTDQGEDSSVSEKDGDKVLHELQVVNFDNGDVNDDNARDANDYECNDDDGEEKELELSANSMGALNDQDESADANENSTAKDPFGFEANADETSKENGPQNKTKDEDDSSSSQLQTENAEESSVSAVLTEKEPKSQEQDDDDDVIEIRDDDSDVSRKETNLAGIKSNAQHQDPDHEEPASISIRVDGIFESNDDDEEIDASVDPDHISSMLEVDFSSDQEGEEVDLSANETLSHEGDGIDAGGRTRPRRAAAAAAASTIREITVVEEDVEEHNNRRKRKDDDSAFDINNPDASMSHTQSPNRQKCVVCKKTTVCQIKIQQFGTDVYICSNACFNNMRYPSAGYKKRLPCCQCGITSREKETVYFWETMNFCSDLCVGVHQLSIANCATCSKKCPWLSIGKYCVRFGSDIRQFCTASCLESYKKNARVCFHCQLDIKRLGNVILANIPSKNTPKEFCSQDCVEMYVEQNLHQTVRSKKTQIFCNWCKATRESFRDLVLPNEGQVRTCSQTCFNLLVESKQLRKCQKCETCVKYINMEYTSELPPHFVSTQETLYGFCSATCKNVFVLKKREILACVTCKVKKYNYDLVQVFNDKISDSGYAVCSLNCLPKSQDYIVKLKDSLYSTITVPQRQVTTSSLYSVARSSSNDTSSGPVINSVVSLPNRNQSYLMNATGNHDSVEIAENPDGTYSLVCTNPQSRVPDATSISSSASSSHYQIDLSSHSTIGSNTNGFQCQFDPKFAAEPGEEEFLKWDGVLRAQDIQGILELIPPYVEMKDVYTMAKPKAKEVQTQTDESELTNMDRVPLKEVEKIRYVPMPIPYAVYIPAPFYLCEVPVPFPVPMPVPVPVPIPVIFDGNGFIRDSDRLSCLFKNVDISPKPNGVAAMETGHNTSESDIVEIDCEPEPTFNIKGGTEIERSGNVELMDCTSPVDRGIPISPDIIPEPITVSTNNSSSNNGIPMHSSPALNSPARSSGANSPFLNSLMNSVHASGSPTSESVSSPSSGRRKLSRVEYGLRAWKTTFGPTSDPLNYSSSELASKLALWVKKGTKPNGERYRADIILYLCLGVQQHLHENNRRDNIFFDTVYQPFLEEMTNYAETECAQGINTRIEDSHFWESGQLGASSPGVLLFTLVYFLYKNFNLKTWEKMANLHFNDIRVEPRDTDVINAFHPKVMTIDNLTECEGMEVVEDPESTSQCPIKFYEIYKSKCTSLEGPFFKAINESFTSTGHDWFSNESLNQMQLYRMLVRAMMIKTSPETR